MGASRMDYTAKRGFTLRFGLPPRLQCAQTVRI